VYSSVGWVAAFSNPTISNNRPKSEEAGTVFGYLMALRFDDPDEINRA